MEKQKALWILVIVFMCQIQLFLCFNHAVKIYAKGMYRPLLIYKLGKHLEKMFYKGYLMREYASVIDCECNKDTGEKERERERERGREGERGR